MNDGFLPIWGRFIQQTQDISETLLSEVRSCTADLAAADQTLEAAFGPSGTWKLEALSAESLGTLYDSHARVLLLDPVQGYRRLRIDQRLVRAFESFRLRLDEAAQELPVRTSVSPRELIEFPEEPLDGSLWFKVNRRLGGERLAMVRAAVLDGLCALSFDLRATEGGLYLLLAQSAQALVDPWQLVHQTCLEQVRDEEPDDAGARFEALRQAWRQESEERRKREAALVGALEDALARCAHRLTRAVVSGPRPAVHRRQLERRRGDDVYWSRQRLTVERLVDIEQSLVAFASRSVRLTRDVMSAIEDEHQAIVEELGRAVDALRNWEPGHDDPFPPASAQLVATAERTRQWRAGLERLARQLVPQEADSVQPLRALPGLRSPWRRLEPRQMLLDAIAGAAARSEDGLLDVENRHRTVLQEIDRAREVVAYGFESAGTESTEGGQIAVEGVANAASLLEHQRESISSIASPVEAALVAATASVLFRFLVAFTLGRFSLVSHVAREGVARAGRTGAVLLAREGRRLARLAWYGVRGGYTRILVGIGWIAPAAISREPVERWRYFGEGAPPSPAELPLIYDRLFRPEPVEDQRFLIGRDEEMTAFGEARDLWKAGRMASIVVDGERGSGKTSLLNCAVAGPFAGERLVRMSLGERLLTREELYGFLAGALAVGESDLRSSLRKEPRIIVVEEVERTYLRKVDGLKAIRELLSLVADTAETNLWVLSLTSEAYRFLDAALGLAGNFSHRLHASAVTPEELQNAVLQRHNLSGLRLHFAERRGKGLDEWIRRQTESVQSSEESFFQDLHQLSGGVFRSAFSIWRRHIGRVDGGVLHMRILDSADDSDLTRALSRDDFFFLHMLLQHGSLTPQEDSEIFDCPLRESYARIERLVGRGILEPEPAVPGFRIQPEAGILVRAALNARNLI